jgi:cytidylate kinase
VLAGQLREKEVGKAVIFSSSEGKNVFELSVNGEGEWEFNNSVLTQKQLLQMYAGLSDETFQQFASDYLLELENLPKDLSENEYAEQKKEIYESYQNKRETYIRQRKVMLLGELIALVKAQIADF